jgi:hypothetical protein
MVAGQVAVSHRGAVRPRTRSCSRKLHVQSLSTELLPLRGREMRCRAHHQRVWRLDIHHCKTRPCRVAGRCGSATNSSPGISIRCSSAVEPARHPGPAARHTRRVPIRGRTNRSARHTSKPGPRKPTLIPEVIEVPSDGPGSTLNLGGCGADHAPTPSAAQNGQAASWPIRPKAQVAAEAPHRPPLPPHPAG